MSGFDPSWLTIAQCVVAGVVVGLCALHWGWWRGELRRSGAGPTLVWSVALALVSLANGVVGAMPRPGEAEGLLLVRFAAGAAAVCVSLPAVHAFAGGRPVRRVVAALVAWYLAAGVLWVTTDLVVVHGAGGDLPTYGPLATTVDLVPLAVVGIYVGRSVRGRPMTLVGAVVTIAGSVSSALLIASSVPPPSSGAELAKGLWVVPLAFGLQVLAASRIATVRRDALLRARMRDALATVANAAWFVKDPERVLERAADEVRTVLGDETIEGTLRPLARDRFVTEFYRPAGRPAEPDAQAFLRDMARVVSSAAERHLLTTRLRQAAFTDALTDLNNRHGLDRYLERCLERSVVEQTRVAVLFCDLDGLKHANDRHGHAWGDALIVRTAEHLRRVVGGDSFVARHGGDEFVVVLERVASDDDVLALARRIREGFEVVLDDVGTPSITVGVATWEPTDVVDTAALVRGADLAMLEGKRTRSGIAVFDEAMRARVTAEGVMRRELEAAIRAGEIVAHFQPLTDAVSLEVVGLEVLARWRRDGRLSKPAEWLPFAEQSGLVVDVGRLMFRAARAGMESFDLPVAVNVAARQLDEADFVRHVEESWGTDAWDRLTIEVTESALLYDAAHVRASLATLAERGVRIAIDDFGTGYNSLSRLGELPLDVLKIDRTFVHAVRRPEGAAVLKAIVALAEAHNLDVVAEGVEHAEELTALVDLGVGTVQGYMLGRPAAAVPVRGLRTRAAARTVVARHLAGVRAVRRGDPRPAERLPQRVSPERTTAEPRRTDARLTEPRETWVAERLAGASAGAQVTAV